VLVAEAPGPEHRAGPEHQRAARRAIERQAVRGGSGRDAVALVGQDGAPVEGRLRQLDEPGGAILVLRDDVPFIADDARREVLRAARIDAGVAPKAQAGELSRNVEGAAGLPGAVGPEQLAGQRVLGFLAGGGGVALCIDRADEAQIAPGPGPFAGRIDVGVIRGSGVDGPVRPGLLIADEGAVLHAVDDAGLPAGFPVDLVAAPEQQVDAGVARRLDIRALVAGPIFVVPHGDIGLVALEVVRAQPVRVDARDVGDVVAVLLQPVDRGVVRAEQVVLRARRRTAAVTGQERPVVADREGAILGEGARIARQVVGLVEAAVEVAGDLPIVAAPAVVGLPGRVGRLQHDVALGSIGAELVLADDERDLVGVAGNRIAVGVEALKLGEIDARDGIFGRIPARGDGPVAGVDHAAGVGDRIGLRLPGRGDGRDESRAVATIIAEAVDLDAVRNIDVGRGVDIDLEIDGRAVVDAEIGREALDLVADLRVPDGSRRALFLVLDDDLVVGHGALAPRLCGPAPPRIGCRGTAAFA